MPPGKDQAFSVGIIIGATESKAADNATNTAGNALERTKTRALPQGCHIPAMTERSDHQPCSRALRSILLHSGRTYPSDDLFLFLARQGAWRSTRLRARRSVRSKMVPVLQMSSYPFGSRTTISRW